MGGGVEGLIVDCYKLGNNQYNHKHPRMWEAVKNADFTRFLFGWAITSTIKKNMFVFNLYF